MSWQDYVDQQLMIDLKEKGQLQSGAICGLDGGIWAKSAAFPPATVEQIQYLITGFTGDAGFGKLQEKGPVLGEVKFFIIQSPIEEGIIRGKCNMGGFCVKRTNQCIVIGIRMEPMTAAAGDQVVENLADYLIQHGF